MAKQKKHPYLDYLETEHRKGVLSRRDFIRLAACLGAGAGAALSMPGLVRTARAAAPKRGGVLKVSAQIQKVTHPAQFSWIMPSNIIRQVAEYMTYFGADNVVKPLPGRKLESQSDDLKTWTFNLRKGVKWNNGDEFTADDVRLHHEPVADQGCQVVHPGPDGGLPGQERHREGRSPIRSSST